MNYENNMNYELAKKLKDAGFPQNQNNIPELRVEISNEVYHDDKPGVFHKIAYSPTLSESIEACGDRFYNLVRFKEKYMKDELGKVTWLAYKIDEGEKTDNSSNYMCKGSTPEEAVANLWLKLNKK